ncbi:MAG: FAD-dependent oxidoreductase [Bacteroidetes bacterium]|nr:FAD-dependent oxidoreductase [Bacteroidota bacterium]
MASYDFDLIVIGGGAGGLVTAGIAANAGVKTMLIERDRLGGDCTWTGCIPSKSLLHSAEVAQTVRTAGLFGINAEEVSIDFGAVMERVRRIREEVYGDADDPAIYEGFGIEVVDGSARFADPHSLVIETADETRRVTGRLFVIATGARATVPPIPGLDVVPFLTNETLFELEEQPQRLVIIGGGPIGIEMAQAFTRLGTEVTVVDMLGRILTKDDADHAEMLKEVLESEGVRFVLGASVNRVDEDNAEIAVHLASRDVLNTDALLLATGRQVNVEGLGLEEAGVAFTELGITVNEKCRTSRRHIYAVGDCTGEYQLTHMSEHMAKVAASNAVLKVPMKIDRKHVPWVTFTSPEIGQLGKTEPQLRDEGAKFEVYRFPYTKVDRATTDGKTTGQIKVFATKWRGKILGVSILGERAGELISLYAVAMRNGVSLKALADTIHPYPSYGLAARRAADQWYARLQSPWAIRLLQRVFRYRGQVPPEPDPERIM